MWILLDLIICKFVKIDQICQNYKNIENFLTFCNIYISDPITSYNLITKGNQKPPLLTNVQWRDFNLLHDGPSGRFDA